MASIFDGVAAIFDDVLGDPITHISRTGDETRVQSIFRKTPVRAMSPEGEEILILSPSWKVRAGAISPDPARGDFIEPPDGRRYKIRTVWPSGSAASDAHLICELEDVFA